MGWLATLLAWPLALIFTTGTVLAHAVLIEAQPADGSVLPQPPPELVLRFNEPISPVQLRVLDADARRIADESRATTKDETLRLPLPDNLPAGTYVASYRVLSADAHPVSGSIVFSIGAAGASAKTPETTVDSERGWTGAFVVVRLLFVFSLLMSPGGLLAHWCLNGLRAGALVRDVRLLTIAASTALAAGALSVGLKGGQLAAAPGAGLLDPAVWRIGLQSSLATSVAVAAGGLLLMLEALRMPDTSVRRALLISGSLAALVSFALTGHAASAAPRWLAAPAVTLHVLCAAFWIGALRPLLGALTREAPDARAIVDRFSAWAIVSVAALLAAGVTLAVLQVRAWAMLWTSPYGLVLLGKLALVAALLALAAVNKWRVTPRLATNLRDGARALRMAILVEYALFAGVLALTAVLSQIEPPRSALAQGQTFRDSVAEAGYRIALSVSPARPGRNTISVDITRDGKPVAPKQVGLELSLPAAGLEPIRRITSAESSGRFAYQGGELALAGRWRIAVEVLIDDFTEHTVAFEVPVRN